jgi:nucleoside-diphosphate-sugar epimerase
MMQPGRVLVTGASGFVGSHVAEALAAAGWRVRGLLRPTSSRRWLEGLDLDVARGDVTDPASLGPACAGCQAVVHVAGVVNAVRRDDFFRVNHDGTRDLREAAGRAGAERFVFVSSLAAGGPKRFGEAAGAPGRGPVNAYGRSKLEAERLLLARGGELHTVIVRPPMVYGPRDDAVLRLVRSAARGWFPLIHGGRQRVALVHAKDLARGIQLALERGAAGAVYDVTDGMEYSTAEIARALGAVFGRRVRGVPAARAVLWLLALGGELAGVATGRPAPINFERLKQLVGEVWTASSERARRELGYAPAYDLARGLAETVAWARSAGWLR